MIPSGVYCITNNVNGKQYIGSSVNIPVRWRDHRYGIGSKIVLQAIKKYGLNKFSFDILVYCLPEHMRSQEAYWISELQPAYNIQQVVGGYFKHSAETIEKIRLSQIGKDGSKGGAKLRGKTRSLSPEMRARMGRKGLPNPCTPEKKLAISYAKRGKPLSESHKAALSKAWVARKEKGNVRTK